VRYLQAGITSAVTTGMKKHAAARFGNQRVPDRYPEGDRCGRDVDDIVSSLDTRKPTATRSTSVRAAIAGRPTTCATTPCCSTSTGSTTRRSMPKRAVAVVGPGKGGQHLMAELEAQNLFFPPGTAKVLCVGGYLLQGG